MNRTSTEPEPRVVVIVLNWNGVQDTVQCLRSLQAVTYGNMETIVVDNGSGRSDVAELRRWTSQVTLLENPTNLGFSGGNNVAIRRALGDPRTDYVLILNNDVVVEPDCVGHMISTAIRQDAGMVSPVVLTLADKKTVDRLGIVISAALLGYDMKRWEGSEPFCPSGCAALYSRQLLEATRVEGEYFDEDFFAYAEDVDLGIRAALRGFHAALASAAVVYHKGSASTFVQSPVSLYHRHRNTIWYLAKSVPRHSLLRHAHWIIIAQWLSLASHLFRGRFRLILSAKLAGLHGIRRMLAKRRLIQTDGKVNVANFERLLDRRPFYR